MNDEAESPPDRYWEAVRAITHDPRVARFFGIFRPVPDKEADYESEIPVP